MKNIINISIAGISFALTSDAYTQLQTYLNRLEAGYKNNPDGAEIIADIEARIVELILSKQPSEAVVSVVIIDDIIEQLGVPEQIEGEGDADGAFKSEGRTQSEESAFPRRLYRYSEGAKLGGVCNGLGLFLDIDPTWLRLAMFSPLLFLAILPSIGFHFLNSFMGSLFGTIMLLYFILWLVIPLARSPRQKLEMRGKKINLSSIQESVSDQESAMSQQIGRSSSVLSELFITLGRLVLLFTKGVVILIGFGFAVAAIILLVMIVAVLFGASASNFDDSMQTLGLFSDMRGITIGGYVSLILSVILIPFVLLIYHIIRFIFKLSHNAKVTWILGGIWLLILIYVCAITVNNADLIRDNIELMERYEQGLNWYKRPFIEVGSVTVVEWDYKE